MNTIGERGGPHAQENERLATTHCAPLLTNLRYDLFRQTDGQPGFHLFEIYRDEAAVAAHRASEHYTAYRAKAAGWLAEPPVVKVLAAVDVAAA
ncbi:putative quinol monooxygenase [Burkholderia ambifaria]|jgi:quinol monooxygenase YgiN|uniref:putative quinol monooxygenase n=1 Tax=Burkholderia TaxID=32008 RepID=UPI0015895375|nr:antibiotic biosynthesis monooxygenase [Burkholderia ambifaria]